MSFEYLTNTAPEAARAEYLEALKDAGLEPKRETVAVKDALGRVTAAPVYAHICAPHYNACAMDGIAVSARDTFGAGETTPVFLPDGSYETVDTGDPLPQGRDAVIMIEDVLRRAGGVKLLAPAVPWQHVRQIGEDICQGELLLTSGTQVQPAAMGAMLAAGVLEVQVTRRPVVGIIATGDEIVQPCEEPGEGDIIEFNSTIFTGMLTQWGAETKTYPIVPDVPEKITRALAKAVDECDAVLLCAGSSAGRGDYSTGAIAAVGRVLCHGIAMKPGKPAILGLAGAKPVLGVPGYPVSGILVLENIFRPVIDLMLGRAEAGSDTDTATVSRAVTSSLKYRELVRARLGLVSGRLIAVPLNRGAGVVTSFLKADGIIDIPQNCEGIEAGAEAEVRLLRPMREIEKTIVVTGSHDPLIDELAELLKHSAPELSLASTHVGSMGGVMAIRRGEAHLAGVHLLDTETGEYNKSYIEKYFPNGGVRLLPCVRRIQGLMVAAGNPMGIEKFEDIARGGLRYVNRQKGSGTRVLCDWLCAKAGIDTEAVYGYEREEFTHTSVAAQIAAGSADAGMGILSAARIYGLDFIPICTEQYDLLASEQALELPMVQELLKVLQSDEFRAKLSAMGGYELR